jgi:hypothetical protein
MKRLVLAALALALVIPAFAVPALADPTVTVTVTKPGALTTPTFTVYGRPNRPLVSIDIRTPTAADAAGAAHERLRVQTLAKSEPSALKSH